MSIQRDDFISYINQLLDVTSFKDYAPNGLQVEGSSTIKTIVTGVTASQALIEKAIDVNADALLVHHGFFWKNENPLITGMKKKRIAALLQNDINLLGYHLPLDFHAELGNNQQLGQVLELNHIKAVSEAPKNTLWQGELNSPMTVTHFSKHLAKHLQREPLAISSGDHSIEKVAWCTGGAQDFIDLAAELKFDAYISGEASERTFHSACEQGIHYFGAGHHATERYGIEALGRHLNDKFSLNWHHFDVDNPI